MTARLASGLVVNALIRRVQAAGGFATVLAKGDADAGTILIVTLSGPDAQCWERGFDAAGRPALVPITPGPIAEPEATEYWQRRRTRDRDLWVLELNVAQAERFAAETIVSD